MEDGNIRVNTIGNIYVINIGIAFIGNAIKNIIENIIGNFPRNAIWNVLLGPLSITMHQNIYIIMICMHNHVENKFHILTKTTQELSYMYDCKKKEKIDDRTKIIIMNLFSTSKGFYKIHEHLVYFK